MLQLERRYPEMIMSITPEEKRVLERVLQRGGATLVVKKGGKVQITAYYNTSRLRDSRVRYD
jgi:hypothetical protein